MRAKRILIVSSIGGHLQEVRCLRSIYEQYEVTYVLNAPTQIYEDMLHKTTFITHSERDWRFILNLYEAWEIVSSKRPSIILSAGAGCAVPFALIAKIYGIPTIYIESFTNVTHPSLTGRIMYYLADRFVVQWDSLRKVFPKAIYGGHVS